MAVHSSNSFNRWVMLCVIFLTALLSACDGANTKNETKLQSVPSETITSKPQLTQEEEFVRLSELAEVGDAKAQDELGRMFKEGKGTAENTTKAFEWFKKSAELGNADGQADLGWMYFHGEGVPKNATKAIEWFEKSAAQNNASAQRGLGFIFSLRNEHAKALTWIKKSADQGDPKGQAYLGLLYEYGDGVPKDASRAVEWYKKAAAQGDELGQVWLAAKYAKGQGVSKNLVIAYAWANLAAANNHYLGKIDRDNYEELLDHDQIAEGQRMASNWRKGEVLQSSLEVSQDSTRSIGRTRKQSTGTAFMVSKNGHALTNHHVIDGCIELRVSGSEGVVKVIASDRFNDLALIQKVGDSSEISRINPDPEKLRQGEDIIVFGYPLQSALSSGGNLTQGTVSAVTGLGNNTNQIQITAPVQLGSSGSPVMNKNGDVVGVVSMKLSDSKMLRKTGEIGQNVNFAVSGQTVKTFLDINKVPYKNGGGLFSSTKSNTQIAEEAQKWTLLLECWK